MFGVTAGIRQQQQLATALLLLLLLLPRSSLILQLCTSCFWSFQMDQCTRYLPHRQQQLC
jgi:hypothetical protein